MKFINSTPCGWGTFREHYVGSGALNTTDPMNMNLLTTFRRDQESIEEDEFASTTATPSCRCYVVCTYSTLHAYGGTPNYDELDLEYCLSTIARRVFGSSSLLFVNGG